MKIVLIGPAHPLRGGIAKFNERLAREFQDSGDEVDLVTFSLQYPSVLFPGKTQYTDAPPPKGLRIRVWLNSVNPFNWIWAGWKLRRERPDLIVCRYWLPFMGPCLGTVLRLARSNGHTRTVGLCDNVLPHEKRPGDRLFTRWFAGACHRFVTLSQHVAEELRPFAADKPVEVADHPVYDSYGEAATREESLRELDLSPDKQYVLFFGFIRKYKGLDLLVEAMADPRLAARDLHLIVAGEFYTDRGEMDRSVEKMGLGGRVHFFADYIPDDRVKFFFGASHLVVQPYRSASQSGISQLAHHFGTPMLVTDVGGLPEAVEEGVSGMICKPEPDSLADSIEEFFARDMHDRLKTGVLAARERFSWAYLARTVKGKS
jgi:D-inositol-3-phosphate glycosyltransferase